MNQTAPWHLDVTDQQPFIVMTWNLNKYSEITNYYDTPYDTRFQVLNLRYTFPMLNLLNHVKPKTAPLKQSDHNFSLRNIFKSVSFLFYISSIKHRVKISVFRKMILIIIVFSFNVKFQIHKKVDLYQVLVRNYCLQNKAPKSTI